MTDDAIVLDDVCKSFGAFRAVDGVSLRVPRGSLYGFLGPNGSGKTTTLRMITNILLPDRGRIEVLGANSTAAARDRVAYLPEERGLYKKMTVRRLIHYYASLKGRPRAEVAADLDGWLERFGLTPWIDRKVEVLSKGMSQKLQFISAAVARPELLVLDEPFSGLDPLAEVDLREAILELGRRGATIIFSTHNMAVAETLCDRLFMIYRGKKVLDGTLEEIQSTHGEPVVRLGTPLGAAAVAGLPDIVGVSERGRLLDVRLAPGASPQALLHAVAARTLVTHFELARPSLHDVFVSIARPAPEDLRNA